MRVMSTEVSSNGLRGDDLGDCQLSYVKGCFCARRRQIQLQSTGGSGPLHMAEKILHREGLAGFYRGFLPNALKNLPNKGAH